VGGWKAVAGGSMEGSDHSTQYSILFYSVVFYSDGEEAAERGEEVCLDAGLCYD
jgi:hypothetical protein